MSDTNISICEQPCDSCPFKGRLELNPGRLKEIMDDTAEKDRYFPCHKTVDYGKREGQRGDCVFGEAAVCAGWLEAVEKIGKVPTVIQVAQRMGWVELR